MTILSRKIQDNFFVHCTYIDWKLCTHLHLKHAIKYIYTGNTQAYACLHTYKYIVFLLLLTSVLYDSYFTTTANSIFYSFSANKLFPNHHT